tara:strand:+ start:22820 stop:23011 length:192 start_codon:yes stop_codon:yes gene_type:complete
MESAVEEIKPLLTTFVATTLTLPAFNRVCVVTISLMHRAVFATLGPASWLITLSKSECVVEKV